MLFSPALGKIQHIKYYIPHSSGTWSTQDWEEVGFMDLNEYQRLANRIDQQPETGLFEADPKASLFHCWAWPVR